MQLPVLVSLLASTALALPHQARNSTEWIPGRTEGTELLAKNGRLKLAAYLESYPSSSRSNSSCTLDNAHRRKEWDTLLPTEKKEYVQAVLCLQSLPSISGDLVPGARTRYDDFVGTHLNQTNSIHGTGNFLTWHRYYTWAYEEALRNECKYTGYQPYADWGRYSNAVIGSPLFDGSETSISDNGAYVPHDDVTLTATTTTTTLKIPAQGGGGCVTTGPFANYTVNLGPVGPTLNGTTPNPRSDGKGYNPRCLKRDLNVASALGASDFNTTHLITANDNYYDFAIEMQGPLAVEVLQYGVHAAGHFMVGGDPGGDVYISPGDPFFWFHHANIDRVWWIWQMQDIENRMYALAGTLTDTNVPASRNTTLDDIFDLGVNNGFEQVTIRELVDTMGGPFCYVYEG